MKKSLVLLPLIASIALAQEVKIYTYDSFASDWGAGPALKKIFEHNNPQCSIDYHPFDSRNVILSRLAIEKQRTKADMVIGLQSFMLDKIKDLDLFEKVALPNMRLPQGAKHEILIPYDFGEFAFIYDTTTLNNPPKRLQELVERSDIRVIYQDPRFSSVGRGLVLWINNVYGDNAQKAWKQLARHTVAVGKGWSASYGAFLKGQADVVLSYNTSPLYHQLVEQKQHYAALDLAESPVLEVEYAGVIAGKNNQCAKDFATFLVTEVAQKELVMKNVMLPVLDNIEPHFDRLKEQTLSHSHAPIVKSDQLEAWIKEWQQAVINY